MVFNPGVRLSDRYTLIERIGRGGMSEVWRADDELLGRPVAVKALASPLAADAGLRAATWREARSTARLAHPHVTQVYDYGEARLADGASVPYLVMELVDGQNLADRLREGPLPWPAAARVAAQVTAGLAAAHRLGVVHRDIKPGNVMLTATGAKVLDFGIAALTGADPEAEAGSLIGTPAYAAPERLRRGAADPAGDVYSVGVLLYELLTGRTPITVATWDEAVTAHQRNDLPATPSAPGLPAEIARLCCSCLSPDPAQRPTAGEVSARLTAALGGPDAVTTAHPTIPPTAWAAHPPTLVERSVSDRPAGGPAATASAGQQRIAGSAAVPRGARNPVPDTLGSEPSAQRMPRSRLAAVATAGAIIAAGLVLTLVAAAFRAGTQGSAALDPSTPPSAGASRTTSTAPKAEPTTPTARPRPSTGAEILDEIDLVLTEAVAAGGLTSDAAEDLRGELDALRDKVAERDRKSLRDKAEDLEQKIEDRLRQGDVEAATAHRLQRLLQPLLADDGEG